MDRTNRYGRRAAFIALTLAMGMVALPTTEAATVTLTDDNSVVDVDTGTSAGVFNWTIDGVDHLAQRWYWYRVGAAGPESSIDTLTLDLQVSSDTNFDGDDETLFVRYVDAAGAFTVSIIFKLNGGVVGFGLADLDEQITIENTSDSAITFHFFGYNDYDLANTVVDTDLEIVNGNLVTQGDGTVAVTTTAVTPAPDHVEAGTGTTILDALNDGVATTLVDTAGLVGPDDLNWAAQWTVNIGAGGSFQISKLTRVESDIPVCGDGTTDPDEECDDGNTVNDDGCRNDCTLPFCGDGILDPGEVCDDGNTDAGDGCSPLCELEECGNGILDPGEECDDGNTESGDGCSPSCEVETGGGQGCTPGYWKQEQHFDDWVTYTPDDSFNDVFGVSAPEDRTLLEALENGGGGADALGRHAVAALLNTAAGGVDYFYSEGDVIAIVQEAYDTGEFETAKNALAAQNEEECPLSNGGGNGGDGGDDDVGAAGCTPGYWKQSQHFDSWVTYETTDLFDDVFGVDAAGDRTLLQAVKKGGGGANALGRHAVAALLNATSGDVDFFYTANEIIELVQHAYETDNFEAAKDALAFQNEAGCPLN